MSEWDGTGQAYAVSFAQLTAGAVAPLLDAVARASPGERSSMSAPDPAC
ncbi:hypothetical protein [Microbacterium sp. bgisy203]